MIPDPRSTDSGEPIRVGVIISAQRCAAHEAETLSQLARVPGCELSTFVLRPGTRRTVGSVLTRLRRHGLHEAYRAVDRRIFRADDDASARVPAGVPRVRRLRSTEGPEGPPALDEQALSTLRADALDVLLTLVPLGEREQAAALARYGLWFYDHLTDPGTFFWPVHNGSPIVATTLRTATTGDGRPMPLFRSIAPTNRFSVNLTEDPCLWKSAQFAARCVAVLAAGGPDSLTSYATQSGGQRGLPDPAAAADQPRGPTNSQTAKLIARILRRGVQRGMQRVFFENHWFVAYRRRSPTDGPPKDLRTFVPIEAPAGRYFADPFIWELDGAHHIFVEDYSSRTRRGVISVITLDAASRLGGARPVLERPYHLSYPFLFRDDDGSVLLIPESGDHGTVEAHRATSFPDRWEPDFMVMDGVRAYDSTLLRYRGRTWLFASVAVRGANPWDELFLFSANSIRGPWTAHPMNPIVSDVRHARPAGQVFEVAGRLVRPAQDCSGAYGRRVVLQKIVELSERDYREEPWSSIEPRGLPGVLRTHSYNVAGDYEVVDGFRHRPRQGLRWLRR